MEKLDSNTFEPKLDNWTRPPQIQDVIQTSSTSQQTQTYLMSHLLAAGFRGSEYQLLVLLVKLTDLLIEYKKQSFEAIFEAKGFGNLDDIGIILKDEENAIKIDSYQVKYYNHPISIYDFFNQINKAPAANNQVVDVSSEDDEDIENNGQENESNKSSKNQKMHIGKFFDGWLAWKAKYPDLTEDTLQCIVYTNAELDEVLSKCIDKEKFRSEFASHTKVIHIGQKTGVKAKVCKNFLTKSKKVKVSTYFSEKVWWALRKDGILDTEGCLTSTDAPDDLDLDFEMNLPDNLPDHITYEVIISALQEIHEINLANQADLWRLLYQQAWDYLQNNGLHPDKVSIDDSEKQNLFIQFLNSFCFKISQNDIIGTEKKILENLVTLLNQPPDQIFLCLSYALREWFRREYEDSHVPVLTDKIMNALLQESLVRSREVVLLQGRSEETLSRISFFCEDRTIERRELNDLKSKLERPGLVLVVGEKGLGKSALIKQALQNQHPSGYLAFNTIDVIQQGKLKETLYEVLQRISGIRIVVLDSAEALLNLAEEEIIDLLNHLDQSKRTVILTVTPEAARRSPLRTNSEIVFIQPLEQSEILHIFHELYQYQKVDSLMELAKVPFYLKIIIKLTKQMSAQRFDYLVTSRNTALEAELVKLVVEGREENGLVFARRLAWQELAFKIASDSFNLGVKKLSMSLGLNLLIREGIIVEEKRQDTKLYHFDHDLYFEHGLMSFLLQKWEIAIIKGNTPSFWRKLSQYSHAYKLRIILEKWFVLYWQRLKDDLVGCIETVSKTPYFTSLIAIAIVSKLSDLLIVLLDSAQVLLDVELNNIIGHDSSTYILLAIWYDNPVALDKLLQYGANPHHPHTGPLKFSLNSAYYDLQKLSASNSSDGSLKKKSNESESDEDSEDNLDVKSRNSENSEQNLFELESEQSDSLNELIDDFILNRSKYWSASFDEEPDFEDDEGWVTNSRYPKSPDYDAHYIHQTVMHNRMGCLALLLDAYNKLNQQRVINLTNEYGETPLHIAASAGAAESVELLLVNHASVDLQDEWGETPLHNAVYKSDIEIVKLLLQKKANPNQLNKLGLSPYHIAIVRLDLPIIKVLFNFGADLSIPPFKRIYDDMFIADLLERRWDNAINKEPKEEIEDFVLELIALNNYGWDDETFNFKECHEEIDQLMLFVDHRAKLSEVGPGFDYWDEESKLDYAVDYGDHELIEDLIDYILDDPESIAQVLNSDAFSSTKEELLEEWLERSTTDQYLNLKEYAENYNDNVLLARIKEDMLGLDENELLKPELKEVSNPKSKSTITHQETELKSDKNNKSDVNQKQQISNSGYSIFNSINNKKGNNVTWQNINETASLDFLFNKHLSNLEQIQNLKESDPLLIKLQQENQTLETLIREQIIENNSLEEVKHSSNSEISLIIKERKYTFTKKNTPGDGWCAFYAVGLDNPEACINSLIEQIQNQNVAVLPQDLAYNIFQNYITSLPIPGITSQQQLQHIEQFAIGPLFKKKIASLYQNWNQADNNKNIAYQNLMDYLSQKVVIISYLNHLLKERYASIAVVKTYMTHILQQQVGIIVKYDSQYYADIPDMNQQAIKYVLFDPSQRMASAHYSQLELKNNNLSADMINKPLLKK